MLTMSSDGKSNEIKSEPNQGSNQAPFHSLNNGQSDMSHNPAGVASSVVKDLLRVYESLTQSSTPQNTTEDYPSKPGPRPSSGISYSQGGGHPQHQSAATMYHIPPPTYPAPQQQLFGDQASYGQQPYGMTLSGNDHPPEHGYSGPGFEIPSSQPPSNEQGSDAADTEADEPPESNDGRARRKRRGSDLSSSDAGLKGRKKNKATDGRWSKRFTWPDDLHRDFVSAIFDVGLKHSSPSTIMEHMPKNELITTERIKSHLQKYRMHRVKSKKEFISSYEVSLRAFQENGMECVKSVSGGATAAQLTFMETSGVEPPAPHPVAVKPEPTEQEQSRSSQQNEILMLPQLTEAEKASPMGAALGHLMGLFLSLKQQLISQRIAEGRKRAEAQAAAALSSSASLEANEGGTQNFKSGQLGRTNIEENSIMKREMQNQMELQNKMRALKQQELNKYKNLPPSAQTAAAVAHYDHTAPAAMEQQSEQKLDARDTNHIQGAGETAGSDGDDVGRGETHPRGLSWGNQDDFWNTGEVDDQLFDFLMNN